MSHADTKKSVSFAALQKAMRQLPPQVFDHGIKDEFKSLFQQMHKDNNAKKQSGKLGDVGNTLNAKNMAIIKEAI